MDERGTPLRHEAEPGAGEQVAHREEIVQHRFQIGLFRDVASLPLRYPKPGP